MKIMRKEGILIRGIPPAPRPPNARCGEAIRCSLGEETRSTRLRRFRTFAARDSAFPAAIKPADRRIPLGAGGVAGSLTLFLAARKAAINKHLHSMFSSSSLPRRVLDSGSGKIQPGKDYDKGAVQKLYTRDVLDLHRQ